MIKVILMNYLTLPSLEEVKEAAKRLQEVSVRTPLLKYDETSKIYIKPETLQPVKSFKLRGVFNTVTCLTKAQRKKGISTLSAGNTAQALGWTANYYDIPAKTTMFENVPENKIQAIKSYGVKVVLLNYDEMKDFIFNQGWLDDPYTFIHPWYDHNFRAGNGTIGLEVIEDLPEVDTVYIPVGGGGLMCGVGNVLKTLKPDIRVVGIQPEVDPALQEAFKAGKGVMPNMNETISDISAPIMDEMYPLFKQVVDDIVLVSEKEIKKAIKNLLLKSKLVVEGAGALSLAASMKEPLEVRGTSVSLITGGSISKEKLIAILNDPSL